MTKNNISPTISSLVVKKVGGFLCYRIVKSYYCETNLYPWHASLLATRNR